MAFSTAFSKAEDRGISPPASCTLDSCSSFSCRATRMAVGLALLPNLPSIGWVSAGSTGTFEEDEFPTSFVPPTPASTSSDEEHLFLHTVSPPTQPLGLWPD